MAGSHATSSSDGTSMTRHHNFKTSAGRKIVKALKEKYFVCVCVMIKTSLHEPTRVGSLNLSDPELTNTPPNLVRSVLNPTSKNTVCAFRGLFRTHATFLFKCRGIYPRTDKPNLQRGAFSQCSVLSHTRRRCPVTRRKSMKNILPAKIFNKVSGKQ